MFEVIVRQEDRYFAVLPFEVKAYRKLKISKQILSYMESLGFIHNVDYSNAIFLAGNKQIAQDGQPKYRLRLLFVDHSKAMIFKLTNHFLDLKVIQ